MATIKEHEEECKHFLGHKFTEVHEFLDQFTKKFPIWKFLEYHRSFLHNKHGVRICREKWGKGGEKAAILHIVRDFWYAPLIKGGWKLVNKHKEEALTFFGDRFYLIKKEIENELD